MLQSTISMVCPNCKAEYLHSVTRCSDCDVALVDDLSKLNRDPDGELANTKLKRVWSGEDQNGCVNTCEQLRNAGIPYEVAQRKRQFFKAVDEHYEIGVPPEYYDQAKQIADGDRLDFSDEPGDQAIMEIPADDTKPDITELERDRNPGKWASESATAELQLRDKPQCVSMVESSLRENQINYRVEVLKNGSRRIFVMPKDALQSREIVREIENGIPPK